MSKLPDVFGKIQGFIRDTWRKCAALAKRSLLVNILNEGQYLRRSTYMLTRFSVAVNILPFYGYSNEWESLMTTLWVKTRSMYKKHAKLWIAIERKIFGDERLILNLMNKYHVPLNGRCLRKAQRIDCGGVIELDLYSMFESKDRFIKKLSNYKIPKVHEIRIVHELGFVWSSKINIFLTNFWKIQCQIHSMHLIWVILKPNSATEIATRYLVKFFQA